MAIAALLAATACESPTDDDSTVRLTIRIRLRATTEDVGPAGGAVWIFASENDPVFRAFAHPSFGISCPMTTTPVTVCEEEIPANGTYTFLATEPDPAIFGKFGPPEDADTLPRPEYVAFAQFTGCDEQPERGTCVVNPSGDVEIEAEFQYLTPVVVYQIGAARFDYLTFQPLPSLQVPARSVNLIDGAGCQGLLLQPTVIPCDTVHKVGAEPQRRILAFVPRLTTFVLRPFNGSQTNFVGWSIPCGVIIEESGCFFRSPADDTSGTPVRVTLRYEYWDCPSGPSDRDLGGCTLVRPD
ncbi:MAG TPA: hypothetical protein VF178_07510 [Gemmatimonadaceae bacterium]